MSNDIYQIANEAAETWFKSRSSDDVRKKVHAMLEERHVEIVLSLMGFRKDSWDGWEIDNCNGRAGESMASDILKRHAQAAIEEWLVSQVQTIPLLTATQQKQLQKSAKTWYMDALKDAIQEGAIRRAKDDASAYIDGLTRNEVHDVAVRLMKSNSRRPYE